MDNVLKVDNYITKEKYIEDSFDILSVLRPQWKYSDLVFRDMRDGITNTLFLIYHIDIGLSDGIVFRLYGAKTELIIDREREIKNINILQSIGCSSKLYAIFNNGIAYEFVEGDCLSMDNVRNKHISSLIAKEMVKLHYNSLEGMNIDREPFIFPRIREWLSEMPDSFTDPKRNERFELKEEIKPRSELLNEVTYLENQLSDLDSPSVLCHNDLLLKNIVYNENSDKITFIDHEYCSFNYEGFDIGNHFNEFAGIDEVDYSLYPDKDFQIRWLRQYLLHKAEFLGQSHDCVTDEEIEKLYVISNKFALVSHFFWGVWALIQARFSTINFDYLNYAVIRFKEYFAQRDIYLKLQVSCNVPNGVNQ